MVREDDPVVPERTRVFEKIFECSLDGVLLTRSDGSILRANPAACRALGRSEEEVCGAGRKGLVVEEEHLPALLATRATTGSTAGEITFRRPDGSTFPAELTSGFIPSEGGPQLSYVIFRDITERRQAEDQQRAIQNGLREREYLLSASQRAAHVGTWSWKVGETKVFWSDETYRIYGLDPGMGPPDFEFFFDLVHPEDRPKLREWAPAVVAGSRPPPVEFRAIRPDGSVRLIWTEGDVVETVDGVSSRIAGVAYDVTDRKRTEAALLESERQYRELFEKSPLALSLVEVVCDAEGLPDDYRFLLVNPAYERYARMKAEDLIGRTVLAAVPAVDRGVLERILRVAMTGVADRFEGFTARLDSYFDMALFSPQHGQCVTCVFDITERKRAEAALRESEQRYRGLFEASPVALFLSEVICDDEGRPTDCRFLYVNPAFERFVHATAADLVGRTLFEFNPQTSRDMMDRLGQVALTGVPDSWEGYSSALDTYYEATLFSPQHGQCVTYLVDISERQRAQEALRNAHDRLAKIVATMPGFVCSFRLRPDGSACFPFGGERLAEHFGLPQEVQLADDAAPWLAQAHPADLAHLRKSLAESAQRLTPFRHEWRVGHPARGELWIEAHSVPLREPDGSTLWHGVAMDVTERKHAEEAIRHLNAGLEQRVEERTLDLAAANRELEAFSYSVSHDLRAPLRGINGFSQALIEDCADTLDDTGRGYLARIQAATGRMGDLIDNLLRLSKVARTAMRREPIDLSAISAGVVAELRRLHPERRVDVTIAPGLAATGDRALVAAVLENLVGNAWKFTSRREHAHIEIGGTTVDGRAAFFVRDDGAGFDMTYGDKLFAPFQRLHSSAEFDGTGIGLAIIQRVVQRHGGRVRAEGAVGQGATFTFTLS